MKKYFWMIAIVALMGFFSVDANAYGHHGRQRAYSAGYHQGVRDARYAHRGYYHPRYYGGYYGHRHYHHHGYYGPRPAVVRVAVPVPRPPRIIIRP